MTLRAHPDLRVLAFDLSLSRTGATWVTGRTASIYPDPGHPTGPRRLYQLKTKLERFIASSNAHVAVIEGYGGGPGGDLVTIRLAELGGVVRALLHEHGSIPVVEIHPSTLKSWAGHVLGHHPKSKDDMLSAALTLGFEPANHDEADAALLYAIGQQRYAWRDDWPGLTQTLARLPWPDITLKETARA